MEPTPFIHALGSEVKDKITGYVGIVRGRTQYLTGCNTYGVQNRELSKDKAAPSDWVWFDEHMLEATGQPGITLAAPRTQSTPAPARRGGPITAPPQKTA